MNIFRFIADMLHLSAILILLYRIKKSRNCIGTYLLSPLANPEYRLVLQDPGTLLDSLLHEVSRPVHVLHLPLQHAHEDLLHRLHRPHNIPHEI